MTLRQLNEHYELVEKLISSREIVNRLRASVGLKAQKLSGMPRGGGTGDLVGNSVVEIVRMEEKISQLETIVAKSQEPVEEWISTVDDYYVQTILRLRFLHGLKWQEVADSIGGGNTAQSVKVACYRVLD